MILLDMSCFWFRQQRQYEQPGVKEGAKVTSRARQRMSEARKGKMLSAGKPSNSVNLNNFIGCARLSSCVHPCAFPLQRIMAHPSVAALSF